MVFKRLAKLPSNAKMTFKYLSLDVLLVLVLSGQRKHTDHLIDLDAMVLLENKCPIPFT